MDLHRKRNGDNDSETNKFTAHSTSFIKGTKTGNKENGTDWNRMGKLV